MDLDTRRAAQPALTDMAGKQPGFSRKAVAGWLLFDWAAQPVHTLVTTFVFAPYFASTLAPTPAAGQALWGYATAAAGLTIALLAPLLGSIADRTGARKRWVCAFSVPLVLGCLLLWFAVPGGQHAVPIALFGFVLATIGVEFATVFNNAMMSDLVPSSRLGRLSGSGWALGYVGGLVSLVIALGLMAANPETGMFYVLTIDWPSFYEPLEKRTPEVEETAVSATDRTGATTTFEYDSDHRVPVRITYADGSTSTRTKSGGYRRTILRRPRARRRKCTSTAMRQTRC